MASNKEIIYKTKGILKVYDFSTRSVRIDGDVMIIGSDEWRVSLVFKDMDGQQFIGAALYLLKSTEKSIEADFRVYILDTDYHRIEKHFFARHAFDVTSNWGFPEFVSKSAVLDLMDKYLLKNCLTIGFNVTVYKPIIGHKKLCRFPNSFLNKDLNDCRLVVKGKEFFASKAILSDRSEVFHNMFTTEMSEKILSEVIIDDIEPQVFEEFRRFLYLGDSEKLEELAEELLYVSDKYMASDLKEICVNLIYLDINPKNAFKTLEVMDKYKCEELKTKVVKYIGENIIECLESNLHKHVGNDVEVGDQLSVYLNPFADQNKSIQTMSYTYVP